MGIAVMLGCRNKSLEEFRRVEESMKKAGDNIDNKNRDILEAFRKDNEKRGEKVGPYYRKAQQADSITNVFLKHVDGLIKQVEQGAGGRNANSGDLENNDDVAGHYKLFIEQGEGTKLKRYINATRVALLELLNEGDKEKVKSDFIASDDPKTGQTWEVEWFEHAPAAAVVTLLEKIKNDAKNTEAQVLEHLARAIDKKSYTFDKVEVKIIPKAGCVTKEGKFQAEIMLVAYDTEQEYEVVVDGQRFKSVDGVVDFEQVAKATGKQKIKGYMEITNGIEIQQLPFETEYVVRDK